jgi:hypothetical protein
LNAESTYTLTLPGQDEEIPWLSEADVRATLEAYRVEHPKTMWSGAHVHELRPGETVAIERSVFHFIDEPEED